MLKVNIEIQTDDPEQLKNLLSKLFQENFNDLHLTIGVPMALPEQVTEAIATQSVEDNQQKLEKFLNYLSSNSKSLIDLLMRRNKPVLVSEIIQETTIKNQFGIGGALRGVTAAAGKVGMPNPVRRVRVGDNTSFEFVGW